MKNWLTTNTKRLQRGLIASAFIGSQLLGPISPLVTNTAHAATQHAGPWTIFAYNDRVQNSTDGKHVQVSGSTNTFHGDIKSNGDYHASGSNNIFNGIVRYYDDTVNGSNTYNDGTPAQQAFSATYPGNLNPITLPACTFGSMADNTNLTLSNASANGTYCRGTGKISISDSNVTKQFTLITNGLIEISGQNVVLTPHQDGLLLYSGANSDSAIEWKGSGNNPNLNTNGTGLAFAPNGDIDIEGSTLRFCMQFAGEIVRVQGSNNIFNECIQPQNGSVQVNKQVDTDGNGSYEGGNTEANNLGFRWGLDGVTPARNMGTTASDVTPGVHQVNENSVTNYSFTGWFTTGSTQNSCTNPQGNTLPVPVTVTAGQTASITLCNARDTAQIKIVKVTQPTNDNGTFDLKLDGVTKATGGHGTNTGFLTVPTGNYTVSETGANTTSLNDYNSSVDCGIEGSASATSIQVSLSKNEQVVCTFTNIRLVSINGTKYEVNTDSSIVGTLEGWTIFIDSNGNGLLDGGELSTTTDASGNYSFNNLTPGSFTLEEIIADLNAWTKIYGPAPFSLTAGQSATGKDFGNFRHGSINGFKFNDLNGNGSYDNEPKLEGWTITLFNDNNDPDNDLNNQVAQTSTDATGNYSFTNLAPDTYAVCETLQPGWFQTTPLTNGGCHIIEINESGETNPDTNFGNFQEVAINGYKWHDLDGNGQFDAEPKLEGWTIFIDLNDNGILNAGEVSTSTAADGAYSFSNLGPGTYDICEVPQVNWTQTFPAGNGCHGVTVESGQTYERNFGNKRDTGTIIIKKELIPANDPGRFNLNLGDEVLAQNVGNGGQGSKVVPTGNYSVSETGFGGTNLANYETTYACTSDEQNREVQLDLNALAVIASGTGTGIDNLELDKDETITCTFKNQKKEQPGVVLGTVTKPTTLAVTGTNTWLAGVISIALTTLALSAMFLRRRA